MNTTPPTYNSIVTNNYVEYHNKLTQMNRIITIAEAENKILLDAYKDEDIVLIDPIDITTYPLDKPLFTSYSFLKIPVCPQINIEALHKCKEKIHKKYAKYRFAKVATFLRQELFPTA
jgi:hypothetical protein